MQCSYQEGEYRTLKQEVLDSIPTYLLYLVSLGGVGGRGLQHFAGPIRPKTVQNHILYTFNRIFKV